MSAIGPAEFEEKYGGSVERLRRATGALRIYRYENSYATGVRDVSNGRYSELHEDDEVRSPYLEWIDPALAKELEHPDETRILELGRLEHDARTFAKRLSVDEPHLTFEELSRFRESCRAWQHRAAANFEAHRDGLAEGGRVLDLLLAATPFVARDALLACRQQVGRLFLLLNYLYHDAIAMRGRVRAQRSEALMFSARADGVPEVQASTAITSAASDDVSVVLIAAGRRDISRLQLRHEAKRIRQAVVRARRPVR